jgi:hypothetical protein
MMRVDQQQRPGGPVDARRVCGRAQAHRPDHREVEVGEVLPPLPAVELDRGEARLAGDLANLGCGLVHEDPDAVHARRELSHDGARLGDGDGARRARRHDESERVGAGLDRHHRRLDRGVAAHLDPHHRGPREPWFVGWKS